MDLDSLAPFAVLEIEPASRDSQPIASPETCGFGSGREKRELERKRVAGDQDALVLTPVSGPQHRTAAVSAVHARGLMAVMHVHVPCATCPYVTGGGRAAHVCLCTSPVRTVRSSQLCKVQRHPPPRRQQGAGSLASRSRARTSRFSSPRGAALLLFFLDTKGVHVCIRPSRAGGRRSQGGGGI